MVIHITFIVLLVVCFNKEVFAEDDVEFYLYNELNTSVSNIYIGNEESLEKLKTNLPVRIIIHGWKGSYNNYPTNILRNAYLQKGNLNVIVVNWKRAHIDDYFLATSYLKETGKIIADMITFLNNKANVKFSHIYIAGHSLGAHLAGISGRNLFPNKIDTIFALDPARYLSNNDDFIKRNDAEYIEVIHTNADPIGVGIREKIGDSDFYPNYGKIQPHCRKRLIQISCNHISSVLYLAESINSDAGFYGIKCNQLGSLKRIEFCECTEKCQKFKMGGEPSSKENKTNEAFYLETNYQYPFAIGK